MCASALQGLRRLPTFTWARLRGAGLSSSCTFKAPRKEPVTSEKRAILGRRERAGQLTPDVRHYPYLVLIHTTVKFTT